MLKTIAQCLLIGATSFFAREAFDAFDHVDAQATARQPLVISAAEIADLRARWQRQTGSLPGPHELRALVRQAADGEMLLRTARELGLGRVDQVVWRRLVENMRFVTSASEHNDVELYNEALALGMDRRDPVVRLRLIERMQEVLRERGRHAEPSEAELRAFIGRNPASFSTPERLSFVHVTLSRQKHGGALDADARALLEQLSAAPLSARRARRLSDLTLLPSSFRLASLAEVTKTLGAQFTSALTTLPAGRWSGPVASSFGAHLVWINERRPAELVPFETIRDRARSAWLHERNERALADGMRALRAMYDLQVEGGANRLDS